MVWVLGLLGAACSSEPSLKEYSEEVEQLLSTMHGRMDANDRSIPSSETLESTRAWAFERRAARTEFLDAFSALTPPEEAAELHETALGILERLIALESAMADLVETSDSITRVAALWDTPTGLAARVVDQDAVRICQSVQATLDATVDREALEDLPWVPPEMREVISVAFGCTQEERSD